MNYEKLLKAARKTNAERDKMDAQFGGNPLSNERSLEIIRIAIEAIKAGIIRDDWNTVAEAQAMLISLVDRFDHSTIVIRKGD